MARRRAALVDVSFTVLAGETGRTHALVVTDTVHAATAVQTGRAGLHRTLVDVLLALLA